MRQFNRQVFVVLCVSFIFSYQVWAGKQLDTHDGSAITITSPQNGAIVESAFELVYSFRKGVMADHAHVFMDGTYQKGFKGTFSDVPSGKHTITVKVATHDHDMVTVSDSIEVIVK
ncbi:MAG: hypothetical protein OEZ57_10200 [Nitrospirota bacterium]|nr:hypothetical protein [Nitrospirota bacterium]MDH5775271.1 hypothetical protein [Nitrospirota bacterium]